MHTMVLEETVYGVEKWVCPTCGRTLLVSWNPTFHREEVVVGDTGVGHVGAKGGVKGKGFEVRDPALDVWAEAINKLDLSDL